MFRILLPLWLLGQWGISAGTLEFTETEKVHINSASRLSSLPGSLQQRVANNTLLWMTRTSGQVLGCWVAFGGESGIVREPRPPAALVRHTRETCAAAVRALSADTGPAPRTADMVAAITEFRQASLAVVQSALAALDRVGDDAGRTRAIVQFDRYSQTLETGRLPVWMLRAAAEPDDSAVRQA